MSEVNWSYIFLMIDRRKKLLKNPVIVKIDIKYIIEFFISHQNLTKKL